MPHVKDAFGLPLEHTAPSVDQMNAASTAALNPPQQTMGASSTDMSQVNAGALTALPAYQQALAIANQVYTEREPMSPALLSLMYFSKLAEESSKPGATLLGAAGAAAATPAAYLAKERELERADEKAKGTLAATLTSTLAKAPAKATAYTLKNNPDEVVYYTPTEFAALTPTAKSNLRPFKEKDASTQKPARYLVNDADAVNEALGTNFADGDVESLTADDFNKVGRGALSVADKPSAGAFQERNLNYLVSNADAIKNGTADATQIAQYGVKYQQLAGGTERTETVDGVTRTIRIPGVDLTNTGLPVPEGFDPEQVINERRQKFDQSQQNSATFGARMLQNEGAVRDAFDDGYEVNIADIKKIRALELLGFGAIGLSPQAQKFHAAASNWVAAQLRQESGAAIGPKEYADALVQYFPQAGDSNEVIQSKRALRETATMGMVNSAGDAFKVMYPEAVPFLTFKRGDETFNIPNPKGYYAARMAQTLRGADLYFEDSLTAMSIDELKAMLAAPNAGNRYSASQLDLISAEIDRKEQ
jgi:hypothetical protein